MIKGLLNSYRVVWILLILAFAGLIWWFSVRSPEAIQQAQEFDSSQIKRLPADEPQDTGEEEDPADSFQDTAPREIVVDDADFNITGADGDVEMKLWVKSGTRDGSEFKLVQGTLQFQMKNHSTLLLNVTDGLFASEEGSVRVEGSITGQIYGTDQFFEARRLVWQQDSNTVHTETVRYIGPFVDVTAQSMDFDVESGEVTFSGPVTAGI